MISLLHSMMGSSCYHKAISKFKEYNINCIFFIVPKFIGEDDYLSWDMIKDMSNNGVILDPIHIHIKI